MAREGSKAFAKRLGAAGKAKLAAELYVTGMTWDEVAAEVGYSHRATAMTAAKRYRDELPNEAVEDMRRLDTERTNEAYADARKQRDKITDPEKRLEADVRLARIAKTHAEVTGVIKTAAPVAVNVTQTTNTGWDYSKLTPDELALVTRAHAKATAGS